MECSPESLRSVFVSGFANPDPAAADLFDSFGPDIGECFFDGISVDDADQSNRIAALVYAGQEQPAPAEAIDPGAELMADCVDLGDLFTQTVATDPAFAQAVDSDCVSSTLDRDSSETLFGELLTDPAALEAGGLPAAFDDVFGCIQFGELFAQQFEGLVDLSEEEITCINVAFQDPAAIQSATSGDPDALSGMLACLEPENLAAFAGGGG